MSNERSPRESCWTTMGTSGICNLRVAGGRQRSGCATMWLPMPSVRREVLLPVEPERAWELITDPEELEGWLAYDVYLPAEGGGRGRAGGGGGGGRAGGGDGERREGVVEEVAEGRRIVFTWGGSAGEEPSRVVWTLDPVPAGTRFVVTERTLAPVVGPRMAALAMHAALCPA